MNNVTVAWFAIKGSGAGENTVAKGDNAELDCAPFWRPGKGLYTRVRYKYATHR